MTQMITAGPGLIRPSTGGGTRLDSTPSPTEAPASKIKFGKEISGSLCAVYVSIRRPSGSIKLKEAVIEAPTALKELKEITSTHITTQGIRYDFNEMWDALDDNENDIRRLVRRTTAQNLQRGTYMMSMLSVGEFVLTLQQLREDRMVLVSMLRDNWEKVLDEVREEFPDHHHLFLEKIPTPVDHKFEVTWEIYPLGTLDADDLDLTNLSEAEKQRVIQDTKEKADELFTNRLQNVFDGVFGAIMDICKEIELGKFETGRRRQGAITNIMDVLHRAKSFSQFADAKSLAAIESAYKVVETIQVQDLNSSTGDVRVQLKDAFAGVREQVERLREGYEAGSSRAQRRADF